MLDLSVPIKSLLGDSFSVTHAGPSGSVAVTVNVGFAGRDDGLVLPGVFINSSFGNSNPSDINGGAAENVGFIDLQVQTLDDDDVDGFQLRKEIHDKILALLRASEKSVGDSYFTYSSYYRDDPPRNVAGYYSYVRTVTIRGTNLEKY